MEITREEAKLFPRRIIIADSRDVADYRVVSRILDDLLHGDLSDVVIIEDAARGVDRHTHTYALERNLPCHTEHVGWDGLGKAAGHIRNGEMAKIGNELIALWDSKSPGTHSMIKIACKRQLKVIISFVLPEENPYGRKTWRRSSVHTGEH